MKKIIKKLSAAVMAFTLLGTGTAITKNISPKANFALSAHAACNHHCPRYGAYSNWTIKSIEQKIKFINNGYIYTYVITEQRTVYQKCNNCSATVSSYVETRTR